LSKKGNDFGDLLTAALEEAVKLKEGRAKPARVSRVPISAGSAEVERPPNYTPARIREIRRALLLSQAVFAEVLNVSTNTVAAWEQGQRQPRGPTLRLLELAERDPEVLASRVRIVV